MSNKLIINLSVGIHLIYFVKLRRETKFEETKRLVDGCFESEGKRFNEVDVDPFLDDVKESKELMLILKLLLQTEEESVPFVFLLIKELHVEDTLVEEREGGVG